MPSEQDILERCNETELYQFCEKAGLVVSPTSTKQEMIAYILGEKEPLGINAINAWRDDIMSFILDHWTVLEAQLSCPAKSKDPRSCYQCVDTQVMACLVQNKTHLMQIRRSR